VVFLQMKVFHKRNQMKYALDGFNYLLFILFHDKSSINSVLNKLLSHIILKVIIMILPKILFEQSFNFHVLSTLVYSK